MEIIRHTPGPDLAGLTIPDAVRLHDDKSTYTGEGRERVRTASPRRATSHAAVCGARLSVHPPRSPADPTHHAGQYAVRVFASATSAMPERQSG